MHNGTNGTNGMNGRSGIGIETDGETFDVVIVGAGQAGLSTAGWCKSYGLKYVLLERNDEIGQNWTNRYQSAKLHTGQRFSE